MKEKRNIDKFIKSKIGKPSVNYSADHWSKMEAMLDEDRRGVLIFSRKRIALYFLIGLFPIGVWMQSRLSNPTKFNNIEVSTEQHNRTNTTPFENSKNETLDKYSIAAEKECKETTETKEIALKEIKAQPYPAQAIEVTKSIANKSFIVRVERPVSTISKSMEISGPYKVVALDDVSKREPGLNSLVLDADLTSSLISRGDVSFDLFRNVDPIRLKFQYLANKEKWSKLAGPYVSYSSYYREKSNINLAESEKSLNTLGSGILLGARKSRLAIFTGLGTTILREKTNYVSKEYIYDYDTSYVLIKPDFSKTQSGKDLGLVEKQITTNLRDSNEVINCPNCISTIKYLDVPLLLQYHLGKNRLSYFLEVGVIMSMPYGASGIYTTDYDSKNNVYLISKLTKVNLNTTLLQSTASFGVKYGLTPQLDVYGKLGGRIAHNSMMKNYVQRPELAGIQLGINWSF